MPPPHTHTKRTRARVLQHICLKYFSNYLTPPFHIHNLTQKGSNTPQAMGTKQNILKTLYEELSESNTIVMFHVVKQRWERCHKILGICEIFLMTDMYDSHLIFRLHWCNSISGGSASSPAAFEPSSTFVSVTLFSSWDHNCALLL